MTKTKAVTTAVATTNSDDALKAQMHKAKVALHPSYNMAVVIDKFSENTFGKLDFLALAAELSESCKALKDNDLSRVESMLLAQAHALQSIFVGLARKAVNQQQMAQYESFLRLSLKAQSQCRATLETLAAIKNPQSVAFVRQTNIAQGPQQVNNGDALKTAALSAPPQEKNTFQPNELLKVTHEQGQQLDTCKAQSAGGAHPAMATVAAIQRP